MYTGSKQHARDCVIYECNNIIDTSPKFIKLDLLQGHFERNGDIIDEMIREGEVTYEDE